MSTHTRGKEAARLRREQFAHEWLVDFNGAAAALRAGYTCRSPNAAEVTAYRLMKEPDVRAIIQAEQKKRLKKIDITADRVLQEWARIAFHDPGDCFDSDGRLINPALLSEHVRAALASIEVAKDGTVKVKAHDKNRALEMLAKYLGILKDQPPPAQWNLDPATLAKMTTEDLETALRHAEMVQNLLAGKPAP